MGVCCILPLLAFDLRAAVSDVITCSDASLEGAGVCVARCLSSGGVEACLRLLAPVANLFRGSVGLWESFAGLGGARCALALLGIVPAFYVAVEQSPAATEVLRRHWPGAVIHNEIRRLTQRDADKVAAANPAVTLVIHVAGSPCPGFCAWNPYKEGRQHQESWSLLQEVSRVTQLLRKSFVGARVEELEENVASMSDDQRDEISRHLGTEPIQLDAVDLVPQRRKRYFWASWPVHPRREVIEERAVGVWRIRLKPDQPAPFSHWLQPGWRVKPASRSHPALCGASAAPRDSRSRAGLGSCP